VIRSRFTSHRPRWTARAFTGTATVGLLALAFTAPAGASTREAAGSHHQYGYIQTNLVSDQPGVAAITDPDLVNAWGLSEGPTTPLWVSDGGTGVTTLYRGGADGLNVSKVPLTVAIPGEDPTGQVFNNTTGFLLPDGSPAAFIFAAESGKITAWNPQLQPNTSAVIVASGDNAIYKGLALLPGKSGPRLLATDFHNGRIDVFDSSFQPVHLGSHAFTDRQLPAGYAPFNVAVVGARVFVTYANQDADAKDDVAGAGHGFIDVYSSKGTLLQRFARRGVLNSPWGLAVAPQGFGRFSGDLLVGNFGDGRIHAFSVHSGRLQGVLTDQQGSALKIDGLWGLLPGNGTAADQDDLWFSAGPDGESHGLLGIIRSARDD
jgi:uncharacterized protein (TIGR03118 family)